MAIAIDGFTEEAHNYKYPTFKGTHHGTIHKIQLAIWLISSLELTLQLPEERNC